MQTLSHEPPFDRRALRWFRQRLSDILRGALDVPANKMDLAGNEPYFAHLLDWYCERVHRYVHWTPSIHYHGRGFAMGHWEVYWGEVEEDFGRAVVEAKRAHAAQALAPIASLEEWLAADLAGTLPAAPVGGSVALSGDLRARLYFSRLKREPKVPDVRRCPSCSVDWTVRVESKYFGLDLHSKRCPACREQARQKRKARQEAT